MWWLNYKTKNMLKKIRILYGTILINTFIYTKKYILSIYKYEGERLA